MDSFLNNYENLSCFHSFYSKFGQYYCWGQPLIRSNICMEKVFDCICYSTMLFDSIGVFISSGTCSISDRTYTCIYFCSIYSYVWVDRWKGFPLSNYQRPLCPHLVHIFSFMFLTFMSSPLKSIPLKICSEAFIS